MNREQLKTILWLRWRLMNNQWRRSGGLGAVIAFLIGFSAIMLAAVAFTGGLLGAIFGLGKVSPQVIMMVWFGVTVGFLFFWMIGLLTELQRSETIDLQRLMHLPVALGQMFVVNYLVSHFSLSIVLMVPAMLGLGLGLTIARGPEMILLIPLALSMVFMVTAWTYCLRGWLSALMTNPRRRRTVIMGITLAFILLAQAPNLYFNVLQKHNSRDKSMTTEERQRQAKEYNASAQKTFDNLVAAQQFIPPLWVPVGARGLAAGNLLPALLGTLGCVGIGALGLRRAYRSTVRFYHGETGSKAAGKISAAAKKISKPRDKSKTDFLERSIPFAPEQSAALALATFRSLLRAPEVKMAWATSFIVTLIIGGTFFFRATANVPDTVKPFIATGSVVFPVFFLIQFFANQFGFDRDGFRALILSPADRRLILIGKNLAALPAAAVFGALLIALTAARLHLPPLTVLATLFQFTSVLLLAGLGGNLLSILVPYRIQPGSMKPTKMPGLTMLVMMLCQMLFPVAMAPVFAGPLLEMFWHRADFPDFVPVNFICSALLCGLMLILYWRTLTPMGRLLQRREIKILSVITVEVE
jgi:ABC-type multidrug transport system permease subunit